MTVKVRSGKNNGAATNGKVQPVKGSQGKKQRPARLETKATQLPSGESVGRISCELWLCERFLTQTPSSRIT